MADNDSIFDDPYILPSAKDIAGFVRQSIADNADELRDIGLVEGTGLAAKQLLKMHPLGRAAGATMSGLTSYGLEMDRLDKEQPDMPYLEKAGRAGLTGLSDFAWGFVPFSEMFKSVAKPIARYGIAGASNLGANIVNNRIMDQVNDSVFDVNGLAQYGR